jgi:type IV pilus assembly protein PilB
MPSTQGEKVVIRILDRENLVEGIQNLGLNKDNEAHFKSIINRPHGMVLVTGPTGSGKTTTLYTVLSSLNDVKRNILTIEDPVEFDIDGITQTPINPKAGLTFATALRAFMRGDPDVIMVGEIRDEETADVAINAALTGHLVLSTLHTNDAPGAVTRLMDMNIEPFLLSSSLAGVIAQRLVRKICSNCKEEYTASEWEKRLLMYSYNMEEELVLHRGKGCQYCGGSGYKGRTAIFEMMPIGKKLRSLIDKRASTDELRDVAVREEGMSTLRQNAVKLVLDGVTSIEEMLRVTYEQL